MNCSPSAWTLRHCIWAELLCARVHCSTSILGNGLSHRLAAAGMYYLAVVAEDGAVETCGNGAVGRLGIGDEQPRRRLTRVPQALFAGSRVIMLACGGEHTMAVTAAGYAWTCGYNGSGMLGGETRQTGWGLRRWTPGSSGARGS
jgi:alpha-tubulin suppressor-like RCC1 family protein